MSGLNRFRRFLKGLIFFLCVGGVAFGLHAALHSDLFMLRVVEIVDLPENSPLTASEIEKLARIPVGRISLVDVDLDGVEERIKKSPWVSQVRLQKRFPQTLTVEVILKEPVGLSVSGPGKLVYLDENAVPFGQLDSRWKVALPLFSGLAGKGFPGLLFAEIVSLWGKSMPQSGAELSELKWDPETGLRVLVRYGSRQHAWVELGETATDWDLAVVQLRKLDQVFAYLNQHSIEARSIVADTEKKIVVKTAHGS